MIMIDEAHENNQNMTMILTLIKFSLYMNNNITLAIISATMENDEKTYRHFYKEIDDNYKYPLDIYLIEQQINRQLIDKRMHMGVPFLETNFEIIEVNNVYDKIPSIKNEIDILKYIIATYPDKGDILIFKKSEAEIIKMVNLINNNIDIPNDLYAIPFFSTLDEKIKSKIEDIDNIIKRKELSYPKNIQIYNLLNTPSKVNEEPYNRFVIVATNIAEASITINNLSFVIDDGQRMILQYNEKVQKPKLLPKQIATSNRKQRKGRVGRVKKGYVFYTYDYTTLSDVGNFEICNITILPLVLSLIVNNDTCLINNNNNFYLMIDIRNYSYENIHNNNYNLKNDFDTLKNQYIYNDKNNIILYNHPSKFNIINVIYPNIDFKDNIIFGYNKKTLIDSTGIFYIVHPNETTGSRNPDTNIFTINSTNINKIQYIFEYLEYIKLYKNNNLTELGELIINIFKELFKTDNEVELYEIYALLRIISFNTIDVDLYKKVLHYMLLNITFKRNQTTIKNKLTIQNVDYCDFIGISKLIKKELYDEVNLDIDIITIYNSIFNIKNKEENKKKEEKKTELDIQKIIINYTNNSIKNIEDIEHKDFCKKILIFYNSYKIKIQFLLFNKERYNLKYIFNFYNNDSFLYNFEKNENYAYMIFSYIIVKYFRQYIVQKIYNKYYIDYYYKDINYIYTIDTFNNKPLTNVPINYRNNLYYIKSDENNKLLFLMYIPSYVLQLLDKQVKIINNKLDIKKIIAINTNYETDIVKIVESLKKVIK